jgi:hypothetical protein
LNSVGSANGKNSGTAAEFFDSSILIPAANGNAPVADLS